MSHWTVHQGGENRGPYPVAHIQDLIKSGKLDASDLAWREGLAEWQPLSSIPEYAELFPKSAQATRVSGPTLPPNPPSEPGSSAEPPSTAKFSSETSKLHQWKTRIQSAIDMDGATVVTPRILIITILLLAVVLGVLIGGMLYFPGTLVALGFAGVGAAKGWHWLQARKDVTPQNLKITVLLGAVVLGVLIGGMLYFPDTLLALVIAGFVAGYGALRGRDWLQARKGRQAAHLSLQINPAELAMGEHLEGQVTLTAKQPLKECSFEVTLTFIVRNWVRQTDSNNKNSGYWEWNNFGSCETSVPEENFALTVNEARTCQFSLIAPVYQQGSKAPLAGLLSSDQRRAEAMTVEELLTERMLKWHVTVEVGSVPGFLQATRELAVTGASFDDRGWIRKGFDALRGTGKRSRS